MSAAARIDDGELCTVEEQGAVGQAGQRIVVRHVVDARLRRMAVADVADDRHPHRFAVAHHRADYALDRDALLVLVDCLKLAVRGRRRMGPLESDVCAPGRKMVGAAGFEPATPTPPE